MTQDFASELLELRQGAPEQAPEEGFASELQELRHGKAKEPFDPGQAAQAVVTGVGRGVANVGALVLQAPQTFVEVGEKWDKMVIERLPAKVQPWAREAEKLKRKLVSEALVPGAVTPGKLPKTAKIANEWGKKVAQVTEEHLKAPEKYKDSFWFTALPEAAGSAAAFAAGGVVTGVAGLPAWAGAAMMGASAEATAQYYEQIHAEPENDGKAILAWLAGIGVGSTEAIPLERGFSRLFKGAKGRLIQDALIEGGAEWGQEAFQTIASNQIANALRDEDREWFEGGWRSGNAGGLTGVMMSISLRRWGAPKARVTKGISKSVAESIARAEDEEAGVEAVSPAAAATSEEVSTTAPAPTPSERQTAGAKPTTAASPKAEKFAMDLLQESIVAGTPATVAQRAGVKVPDTPALKWVDEWARQRGMEPVFIDAGQPLRGMQGGFRAEGNLIALDSQQAEETVRAVAYHEASHSLFEQDPKAWEEMRTRIQEIVPGALKVAEIRYEQGYSKLPGALQVQGEERSELLRQEGVAASIEEMQGFLTGIFERPDLFQQIARKDRTLAQKIFDLMVGVLNKLPGIQLSDTTQKRIEKLHKSLAKGSMEKALTPRQAFDMANVIAEGLDTLSFTEVEMGPEGGAEQMGPLTSGPLTKPSAQPKTPGPKQKEVVKKSLAKKPKHHIEKVLGPGPKELKDTRAKSRPRIGEMSERFTSDKLERRAARQNILDTYPEGAPFTVPASSREATEVQVSKVGKEWKLVARDKYGTPVHQETGSFEKLVSLGQSVFDADLSKISAPVEELKAEEHPVSEKEVEGFLEEAKKEGVAPGEKAVAEAKAAEGEVSGKPHKREFRDLYRVWARDPDAEPDLFAIAPEGGIDTEFAVSRENVLDLFVRKATDKFTRQAKVQKQLKKAGGEVNESNDAYIAEELLSGKVESRIDQLDRRFTKPIAQLMRQANITLDEVGRYIWARHAEERNEFVMNRDLEERKAKAKRPGAIKARWGHESNPASGMRTSEAQAAIEEFESSKRGEAYKEIGRLVDALNEQSLRKRVENGLLPADVADEYLARWKHYVPLRTTLEGKPIRQGKGFHLPGPEFKKAKGRKSAPDNALIWSIAQAQEGVVRGEKNQVTQKLLALVRANPAPRVWQILESKTKPIIDEMGEFRSPQDPQFQLSEKVIAVHEGGTEIRIIFNDPLLARAWKNLGPESSNGFVQFFGSINRFLSTINTSYDPEFMVSNFLRDIQTASVHLTGEQGAKIAAASIRDALPGGRAMRAMHRNLSGKDKGTEWDNWASEFREAGGKVGWFHAKDFDSSAKDITRTLRSGVHPASIFRATGQAIENMNGAVENGIRLAAYVNLRKSGVSKDQAASVAKNLTVNFNRKGEWGAAMNSAYLFYNASIQGSARMLRALKKPKVQAMALSISVLSALLDISNRMGAGEDDDGENFYDKIPDYVKNRNFIVMSWEGDGKYFKIPLPYGYNIFHAAGTHAAAVSFGDKDPTEATLSVLSSVWESFSPIGSEASVAQMVMPSLADPLIQHAENKKFYGAPLKPTHKGFGPEPPQSQQYWNSVTPAAKWITETLNTATGGDTVQPGWWDWSPEVVEHYFDFATGGVGRFSRRGFNMFETLEETPIKDVPFLRRIRGGPSESHVNQTFYGNVDAIELAIDRREAHGTESLTSEQEDLVRLTGRAKATNERMRRLRIRRDAAKTDEDREKWEEQMDKEQRAFNKAVIEAKK